MNREEYLKEKARQEKEQPIPSTWFKHKITGEYEYQINIMEMNDYEEVKE